MRGMKTLGAALAMSLAGIASTANALVVYDNGGPDTSNGYGIGIGTTSDDFSVATAHSITSVGFYFQNYNGITGWDQQIDYGFFADASGSPGAQLASGS